MSSSVRKRCLYRATFSICSCHRDGYTQATPIGFLGSQFAAGFFSCIILHLLVSPWKKNNKKNNYLLESRIFGNSGGGNISGVLSILAKIPKFGNINQIFVQNIKIYEKKNFQKKSE